MKGVRPARAAPPVDRPTRPRAWIGGPRAGRPHQRRHPCQRRPPQVNLHPCTRAGTAARDRRLSRRFRRHRLEVARPRGDSRPSSSPSDRTLRGRSHGASGRATPSMSLQLAYGHRSAERLSDTERACFQSGRRSAPRGKRGEASNVVTDAVRAARPQWPLDRHCQEVRRVRPRSSATLNPVGRKRGEFVCLPFRAIGLRVRRPLLPGSIAGLERQKPRRSYGWRGRDVSAAPAPSFRNYGHRVSSPTRSSPNLLGGPANIALWHRGAPKGRRGRDIDRRVDELLGLMGLAAPQAQVPRSAVQAESSNGWPAGRGALAPSPSLLPPSTSRLCRPLDARGPVQSLRRENSRTCQPAASASRDHHGDARPGGGAGHGGSHRGDEPRRGGAGRTAPSRSTLRPSSRFVAPLRSGADELHLGHGLRRRPGTGSGSGENRAPLFLRGRAALVPGTAVTIAVRPEEVPRRRGRRGPGTKPSSRRVFRAWQFLGFPSTRLHLNPAGGRPRPRLLELRTSPPGAVGRSFRPPRAPRPDARAQIRKALPRVSLRDPVKTAGRDSRGRRRPFRADVHPRSAPWDTAWAARGRGRAMGPRPGSSDSSSASFILYPMGAAGAWRSLLSNDGAFVGPRPLRRATFRTACHRPALDSPEQPLRPRPASDGRSP